MTAWFVLAAANLPSNEQIGGIDSVAGASVAFIPRRARHPRQAHLRHLHRSHESRFDECVFRKGSFGYILL